jgi:glucan biosynthesis protein C
MEDSSRRYDIDWLRVIAIAFLLLYHIGIGFQPFGVLIGFIQNDTPLESLWIPMSMLNIWRIPLLFFVSGMGVCFALKKRTFRQLLAERSRRILVPFIFGIVAIVPLHLILWQKYYLQEVSYHLTQSHLWFLGNIFTYVLLLSPMFILSKKNNSRKVQHWLTNIYRSPLGLLVVTMVFALEALIINPASYETYASTLHGYIIGFLSFTFGFTFVYTGKVFWNTACKYRWVFLVAASTLFIIRYFVFSLDAPAILKAPESTFWIFTALGFSYKYLNRPSSVLSYLSSAAYPVYILHMLFLYLASYYIMPLNVSAGIKFGLVVIITFIGCFIFYEYIIRRIKYMRILFGLKY